MSQPLHFCASNANLLCEIPFKRRSRLTFKIVEGTFTEAHAAIASLKLNNGWPVRLVEMEDIKHLN